MGRNSVGILLWRLARVKRKIMEEWERWVAVNISKDDWVRAISKTERPISKGDGLVVYLVCDELARASSQEDTNTNRPAYHLLVVLLYIYGPAWPLTNSTDGGTLSSPAGRGSAAIISQRDHSMETCVSWGDRVLFFLFFLFWSSLPGRPRPTTIHKMV
jgi:hypothetical protein